MTVESSGVTVGDYPRWFGERPCERSQTLTTARARLLFDNKGIATYLLGLSSPKRIELQVSLQLGTLFLLCARMEVNKTAFCFILG